MLHKAFEIDLDWRTKTAEKRDRLSNGDAVGTDKKNRSHAERNIANMALKE